MLNPGTYEIYEAKLEWLQAQLAKLNKRAAKLGVAGNVLTVTGARDEKVLTEDGRDTGRLRRKLLVTCSGSAPKLAGWTLVGVIEPVMDEEGHLLGNQTRAVPGQTIPEQYRSASMLCDHCRLPRNRREVFIVRQEEPELFKQVGRQCLADFLGHQSPEKFIQEAGLLMRVLGLLDEADDYESGGGHLEERYELQDFLERTSAIIRKDGWMPRSKAGPGQGATVDTVLSSYGPAAEKWFVRDRDVTEVDVKRAFETQEWMEELRETEPVNDYLYNLSLLGGSGSVRGKQTGLAASAISAYLRTKEREIERAKRAADDSKSDYFGTEKKRELFTLTLAFAHLIPSNRETILHKFRDPAGNVATWFSTKGTICEVGETVQVRATVKRHEKYQGVKQTILTRVGRIAAKTEAA